MDNKKYRLVGICNPFNIIPFMIKPVFEDEEGNLYITYIADKETKEYSPYIKGFSRMSNAYMKYVKNLSECLINSDALNKEYYSIGDLSPCGIEIENNIIYIGQMDKYLDFLKEYKNEIAFKFDFKAELIRNIEGEINFIEPLVIKYKQDNKIIGEDANKKENDAEEFEKKLIKIIENDKRDK